MTWIGESLSSLVAEEGRVFVSDNASVIQCTRVVVGYLQDCFT